MTNENDLISRADAIEAVCMNDCGGCRPNECGAYLDKSCDVVKVLSALPSADAVSMEEHVKELNDLAVEWKAKFAKAEKITDGIYDETMAKVAKECEECKERLRNIHPSAEAVQGWRTGKPTKGGKYIVTLIGIGGYRFVSIMHYDKPFMPNIEVSGACWYRDDDEWGDVVYDDKDILAWMPLPTPYKGGGDE